VHLGLHKTGSTAIQHCFDAGSYHLHQHGVLYPSTGRHPLASRQHGLVAKAFDLDTPFIGAFALTGPIDRTLIASMLRHEIELSGLRTVVLSSEEMSRFGRESLAAFAEAFGDYDIHPVVFIRRFTSIFEGYYATLLLYTETADDLTADLVNTDLVGSLRERSRIAADRRVRVIDADASSTGDSVKDFLAVLDLSPSLLSYLLPDSRVNRSPAPPVIAAVRELRRAGVAEERIRGFLADVESLPATERYSCIPPALWQQLEQRYAEQHAQLRAAPWVAGLDGVPAPKVVEPPPHLGSLVDVVVALGRTLGAASRAESDKTRRAARLARRRSRSVSRDAAAEHDGVGQRRS